MSPATRADTRTDARTAAARLSRLRVLALAERERHHNGWSFTGAHVTQHCPCCGTVRATAPDPPTDPRVIDRYERHVGELLNDAVLDHLRHHCDTPHEERP
jgi:uncharacterized membrane protein YccC